MESFPADFNLADALAIQEEKAGREEERQETLLKQVRKQIYARGSAAIKAGANEVLFSIPDELCSEKTVILARELCQRFPGRVYYHCIINYADVDEFRLIESPEKAHSSFEYKLKLKE
jgi:hypothetical protein